MNKTDRMQMEKAARITAMGEHAMAARMLCNMHRAANLRDQSEIVAEIRRLGLSNFVMEFNGCLVGAQSGVAA